MNAGAVRLLALSFDLAEYLASLKGSRARWASEGWLVVPESLDFPEDTA